MKKLVLFSVFDRSNHDRRAPLALFDGPPQKENTIKTMLSRHLKVLFHPMAQPACNTDFFSERLSILQ